MKDLSRVIKRPVMTEKATTTHTYSTYVFEVDRKADKSAIASAVEIFFNVKVKGVRVVNARGKTKRNRQGATPARHFKKAYVSLKEGQSIQLVEGA